MTETRATTRRRSPPRVTLGPVIVEAVEQTLTRLVERRLGDLQNALSHFDVSADSAGDVEQFMERVRAKLGDDYAPFLTTVGMSLLQHPVSGLFSGQGGTLLILLERVRAICLEHKTTAWLAQIDGVNFKGQNNALGREGCDEIYVPMLSGVLDETAQVFQVDDERYVILIHRSGDEWLMVLVGHNEPEYYCPNEPEPREITPQLDEMVRRVAALARDSELHLHSNPRSGPFEAFRRRPETAGLRYGLAPLHTPFGVEDDKWSAYDALARSDERLSTYRRGLKRGERDPLQLTWCERLTLIRRRWLNRGSRAEKRLEELRQRARPSEND